MYNKPISVVAALNAQSLSAGYPDSLLMSISCSLMLKRVSRSDKNSLWILALDFWVNEDGYADTTANNYIKSMNYII